MLSASPSRFDRGDVDFSHMHHRLENALGRGAISPGDSVHEDAWGNLPRQTPLVLAPAACTFLAAVCDNRIPQAVRFLLVIGGNLERESLVMGKFRPTIEADTGNAFSNSIAEIVKKVASSI